VTPVILNIHERVIPASVDAVGRMIDTLGSAGDVVWPSERWPPMKLDRPLQVGAAGGHGPIRYRVESYEPGRRGVPRYRAAKGLVPSGRIPALAGPEIRRASESTCSGKSAVKDVPRFDRERGGVYHPTGGA